MTVQPMHHRRLAAALTGILLVVGACGGNTATVAPVTPVPTVSPVAPSVASVAPTTSVVPTSSPRPAPSVAATTGPGASADASASASASAVVDPAASLAIASPYAIVALDAATATALQTSIEQGMGAFAGLVHVGTREVAKSGVLAAYVMVLAFPAGTLTDATYQLVVAGLSANATAAFTPTTVSGTTVSTGTMSTVNVGVYKAGDAVMLVMAVAKAEVLPIAGALISSN